MHAKHLHVLLKTLVCLQQVSGRAVGHDVTSISNVANEAPTQFCPLAKERASLYSRQECEFQPFITMPELTWILR